MAPGQVIIDNTPDLDFSVATHANPKANGSASSPRTLLLAPPSIAAHEEKLQALFGKYDRASTHLQMLDRLSAGLVSLPDAAYDLVLVLTDADGARQAEALQLLATRDVFSRLVPAMRPGGQLRSEDGSLGRSDRPAAEGREAVLAGLIAGADGNGFTKPDYAEEEVVPLRFGNRKKKENGAPAKSSAGPAVQSVTVSLAGKPPATLDMVPPAAAPAGVGFIDFSDDFGDPDDDDELIDEDTLLGVDDLKRPIQQPPECQPKPGQKRRACKDCTCGLAARLEAEDKARRSKADQGLEALKLKSEDLNELDFTVKGKTGSCGSCSLGDAFRCEDCPYIGLPPFKPGEEVRILNNVAQL